MSDSITVKISRHLLEHPRALHMRRMRGAIWLYLVLLTGVPEGSVAIEIDPKDLGVRMGVGEGTIRSSLGHLRKAGYISAERTNGRMLVRMTGIAAPARATESAPTRRFTATKLEIALGDAGYRDSLDAALAKHSDKTIQRALAGALAVPTDEIRRSRTALFLYLLKRNTYET